MMNAIFAMPGLCEGLSLADEPNGAKMIMTKPLEASHAGTTVLVVAAGADWTEAGRFRDAKSWHDYVRGEQVTGEQAVARIYKAMVDSKFRTQKKGKNK